MINAAQQHFILHLSLIDGVGPITIKRIIDKTHHQFNWSEYYAFTSSDWQARFSITAHLATTISNGLADSSLIDRELELIQRHAIEWATLGQSRYPDLLVQTYCAPSVLYWRGRLECVTQSALAIIGSRSANAYGARVINMLVPELVAYGCCIVSGGAFGADIMAHRSTLDAGGKTVVVLGSGLLKPYPQEHGNIFSRVAESGGAVVSPFALSTGARPGNFPARNRIIAGLSMGCIVIQAAAKSGTRITAQYALEYGRDVFAVPGPIDDPLSSGCHALLQEGAGLITSAKDILHSMNVELLHNVAQSVEKKNNQDSLLCPSVTPQQNIVLAACRTPCAVDELIKHTEMDLDTIQSILFDLELLGLCARNTAGAWLCTI